MQIFLQEKIISEQEFHRLNELRDWLLDVATILMFGAIQYLLLYEFVVWRWDPQGKVSPLGYRGP